MTGRPKGRAVLRELTSPDDQPDWTLAACGGADTEDFYKEKDRYLTDAKAWCDICPIRSACLEFALANDEHGVWGGMSRAERLAMLHHRNASDGAKVGWQLRRQREAQAGQLRAQGKTPPEIAEHLGVDLRTVQRYLSTMTAVVAGLGAAA
jgi:WhiB family redox-sensing transcriptional regulator